MLEVEPLQSIPSEVRQTRNMNIRASVNTNAMNTICRSTDCGIVICTEYLCKQEVALPDRCTSRAVKQRRQQANKDCACACAEMQRTVHIRVLHLNMQVPVYSGPTVRAGPSQVQTSMPSKSDGQSKVKLTPPLTT